MIRYLARTTEPYLDHDETADAFDRLTRLRGRRLCPECDGGAEPIGPDGPMVACRWCNGRPIRIRRNWRAVRVMAGAQ